MPNQISQQYHLANDSEFRVLIGFAQPPRAGKVTAVLGSGQVEVTMDDQDGGTVTAWPLNGFTYAVDDVVYVAFTSSHGDTGIVIGSKAPLPTLDQPYWQQPTDLDLDSTQTRQTAHTHQPRPPPSKIPIANGSGKIALGWLLTGTGNGLDADKLDGKEAVSFLWIDGSKALTGDWDIGSGRKISGDKIAARSASGLYLVDDAGNGIFVKDGGNVGIGASPVTQFHVQGDGAANGIMTYQAMRLQSTSGNTNGINIGGDGTDAMIGAIIAGTKLHLLYRSSGGVYGKALTIDDTGQVGIGASQSHQFRCCKADGL